MKILEFGIPIELTEAQGRLIDLISKGEWNQIPPEALRSLIPDVRRFRQFLDQNGLADTDEAKVVLKQLGVAQAPKTSAAKAAAAGKAVFWEQRSLKGWHAKRGAAIAKKATGKVKRRKGKKRPSTPTTNRPVKA